MISIGRHPFSLYKNLPSSNAPHTHNIDRKEIRPLEDASLPQSSLANPNLFTPHFFLTLLNFLLPFFCPYILAYALMIMGCDKKYISLFGPISENFIKNKFFFK